MPDESDLDQMLATALAHHEAGQLDHAEAGYRTVLRHDPREPDALNLLGLLLQERGDLSGSIALIKSALEIVPDFPEALVNLARAERAAGAPMAAVRAARRAIDLDPGLTEAHLQLGHALIDLGDHAGAVKPLRCASEIPTRSPETRIAVAAALSRLEDHGSAAEARQMEIALKPDDPALLIEYAASLGELGRFEEALATFRRADDLARDHPGAQRGIALCLVRTGRISAAAEVCRQAVETTPNSHDMWLLLANCEAKLGHFDVAAEAYRRTLALGPGSADVLHDLVALGKRPDDDATGEAAREILGDEARVVRDRIAAGFALGQLDDRRGAYDEAFHAYARANELRRGDHAARGIAFDRDKFRDLVDWLIATIDRRTIAEMARWGDPSELPVFVVGMPRSGTSLVEQIAASHRLVFGAGEKTEFPLMMTALSGAAMVCSPLMWDPAQVQFETTSYVQKLRGSDGGAVRIIDKQPDNIMFLGQIAALFPRARIVVCRRDPRDVCLSCYFQYFQDDKVSWADNLSDCGFRARQIDRLMRHWREVLPSPILEIQYETLIADPEGESRRLIDFLGLDWDPACLSFHATERIVSTASRWQVRQPLYASSVGRWRNYRRHLHPLLAELGHFAPEGDGDWGDGDWGDGDWGDGDWDALAADPAAGLAIATSHHRAGRLKDAASIYHALLRRDPDDPTALHLLGLLMLDRGEPAEAVTLIARSLAVKPDVAPRLASLARAHRAAGHGEAAAAAARNAVALDPALSDAWVELGCALLMDRDDTGAVDSLRRAIEMAPGSLEAQIAYATALGRRKDHRSAEEAWQAALSLRPDDPGLLIEHAGSLSELERFDEALAIYRRAETMRPGHPLARHGIASILARTGDVVGAAELCRLALETTPDVPLLWLLLGHCEAALGKFDAATRARRRAQVLDPGSVGTLHDLVSAGDCLDDDAVHETVRNVLGDRTRPVRDRVAAGFTLGRLSDRRGAHDDAFAAYATANGLLRAERAAYGFIYDRDTDRRLTDWLIATIGRQTFAETAGWGAPSELPVFVVGMPRSGTSLVEQIAASHRLVFGAGERKDIGGILATLGGGQMGKPPSAWDPALVRRETAAHVARLQQLGDGAARVIDKLPLNAVVLGQIAVLFPGARIVICQRDPRDVCLSCFFQYFQEDAMPWTDDLEDCGHRMQEIERLMAHWREVVPSPILEIEYETLVGNLEAESRRLIDFLGLDWDPACLSFHTTERTVTTASLWQVRQPLYGSSVGRWRHYRRHLGPLLRELKGLIPADGDRPGWPGS